MNLMTDRETLTSSTPAPTPDTDAYWAAVCARDNSLAGDFYYAVITTGVYCRPGCPSRRPRRENVRFFTATDAAECAGYRACKRCRPRSASAAARQQAVIERVCRHIEAADSVPDLDSLAALAGYSRFHFHRVFKAVTGVTPREYATATRRRRMHQALAEERRVTDAALSAGFNSHGRFYAATAASIGMTPGAYRRHGAGTRIRFALGQTALGDILVAATARGLCMVTLGDDPEALLNEFEDRFKNAELIGSDPTFEALVAQVIALVEQPSESHALPLDVAGTAFQQRVWDALTRIPPGSTASYSDIALAIGAPRSARAVARACAANTVAVAIPCHRVVRSDGSVGGYRWGVARKHRLLALETQTHGHAGG